MPWYLEAAFLPLRDRRRERCRYIQFIDQLQGVLGRDTEKEREMTRKKERERDRSKYGS